MQASHPEHLAERANRSVLTQTGALGEAQRLQAWVLESSQPRSATVKHETLLNHSETQNSHNKNDDSFYHTRLIQSSNNTMHVKTGSSVVEHRK